MSDIIVTGFEPFDGREVNASWIAAQGVADRAVTLRLPVTWGSPGENLLPLIQSTQPRIVISLGEGRPGWIDFETIGRNRRADRADNAGNAPVPELINPNGPDALTGTYPSGALQRQLSHQGYPARVSTNAGQFLCDETLYTLNLYEQQHAKPACVMFVHIPPFGTTVRVHNEDTTWNEPAIEAFAVNLLDAVTSTCR